MKSITSRSNPLVAEFRQLARTPDRAGVRLLLDGVHLTREAHEAGLAFDCVAVGRTAFESGGEAANLARDLDALGHHVVIVSSPVLDAMSPVQHASGMVAIARRTPLPPGVSADPAAFVVVADGVQDPGNLGALIRTAEAAGVTEVHTCGASAHPFGWRALRGSMGSALRLPIREFATDADTLAVLRQAAVRVVAAVPRDGRDPDAVCWLGRVALIVGSEGAGLSADVVAAASETVTIPMAARVESLNVAAAAAILMYAARRQRAASPAGAAAGGSRTP